MTCALAQAAGQQVHDKWFLIGLLFGVLQALASVFIAATFFMYNRQWAR
jgi:hypothetical protein